ncbi:MAG TPA: LysM peptidoglycan-binding domain-containing protein [Cytophagales bacterium]|nr:LysM peptidoglycan-binding domain-containing protein [Cytophagales bacterium]
MKLLRIFLYFILTDFWLACALPTDSIGVETKNGKTYIKHKVESGETLYRLTRKYGVTVEEIKAENPEVANGFKEGMLLLIPSKKPGAAKSKEAPKTTEKPTAKTETDPRTQEGTAKTHTVQSGQGLFAISRLYKVSVDDLKKWNSLSTDEVKSGQVLLVSKPAAESKGSAPSQVDTPTEKPMEKSKDAEATVVTKSVATTRTNTASGANNAVNRKIIDTLRVVNVRKQDGPSQKNYHYGVAMVLNNDNADKFEAYYDHVPVGSFINVKSLFNEEKVFLKVVGKLPKQSDAKVIIAFTNKALERLQSTDSKLAVEVSYVAP